MLDLVIKGARLADGGGGPLATADLGVTDGRIVETGRVSTPARRTVDADAEDLAAYFAAQEPKPAPGPEDPALMAAGRRLAEGNHCGQCHLPDFRGREQMARLAGQREEYLLKALQDFKAARRSGFDGTMTEAVYNLSDADLPALAHYLARVR